MELADKLCVIFVRRDTTRLNITVIWKYQVLMQRQVLVLIE